MTAAFYCAVHCIEAHLAGFGEHSDHHADRNRAIHDRRFGIDRDTRRAYRVLYNWSLQARYLMGRFDRRDVEHLILGQYLPRVTRLVGL
ncbi:MAG TPA: hypothetical protein VG370_28660 [Chloroflexota bacterium]|nr:hypothetical protein [Chloroflexota bacterium]